VRENVQRERQERRKNEAVQKPRNHFAGQAFDDAIHALEAMAKEIDDVDVQDLLTRARHGKKQRQYRVLSGEPNKSLF